MHPVRISSVIRQYEDSIKMWVDRCFRDPEMTRHITWRLYTGRDLPTQDIPMKALAVGHTVGMTEIEDRAASQQATREYIIRESDLPAGVTTASLTKNDRIIEGTTELLVSSLDKSLEFLVYVEAIGDA